jgi:hypothetical protein
MPLIRADNHQTENRSYLTRGTKTLNVARVLNEAMILISIPVNEFYDCGDIARPSKKALSVCRDLLPGILGPGF